MGKTWQTIKDLSGTYGLGLLALLAGLLVAYQFVDPAPPRSIVMATGQPGGAYARFGEAYAQRLAEHGITVELMNTAGSVENLALLNAGDPVDLAFVQSGLAQDHAGEALLSLGSVAFEPLWLFLRTGVVIQSLSDLKGRRLATGAQGSGTRAVARSLLEANGVHEGNAEFLALDPRAAAQGLGDGSVDAVFLVASPVAESVSELIAQPGVRLHDFQRSPAYVRVYRFLSPVEIPQGVLNLERDLPDETINTVAPAAMLAATTELHPALVDLLLVAAANIHGGGDRVAEPGQFPTPRFTDLPLSPEAERHYQYGPPFLQRILPFWAATLVDRLKIMLLPLIGLAIPLFKLMPPVYRWRIRSRIFRMYEDVIELDPVNSDDRKTVDVAARLKRLDDIETEVAQISVPLSYADELYELRRDLDLIRRKLMNLERAGADDA